MDKKRDQRTGREGWNDLYLSVQVELGPKKETYQKEIIIKLKCKIRNNVKI